MPEVHETEADKEGIKIRTEYTVKEGRLIKVVSHVRVVTEIITRLSKAAMARRQRMCPFGDARTGGCVTTRERKDFFLEAPRAAMEEDDDNDQAVILKKITERRNVLVRPKKPSLFPNGSNGNGGGGGSGGNVTCSAASDDEAPPSFRFEWEDANDRKLQVLNCGDETTEADLQDLFRALFARMSPGGGVCGGGGFRGGPVENVFMPRDEDGREPRQRVRDIRRPPERGGGAGGAAGPPLRARGLISAVGAAEERKGAFRVAEEKEEEEEEAGNDRCSAGGGRFGPDGSDGSGGEESSEGGAGELQRRGGGAVGEGPGGVQGERWPGVRPRGEAAGRGTLRALLPRRPLASRKVRGVTL